MPFEQEFTIKQLTVKEVILLDSEQDTNGFVIKDKTGFIIFRVSSNGNIHMKGDVFKDL